MPTLRTMIDNKTSIAAATASPLAKHVASHLQDPVGQTKEGFDELNQKQLEYELAKQNMQRQLAPVESVIDQVKQTHGIDDDDEEIPGVPNNRPGQVNKQQNNLQPGQQVSQPGTGPAIPQPGNAPSTAKQAVPQKMGQAQPGKQSTAANPSQTQQVPVKKTAPGKKVDPRKIKVHVTANSTAPAVRPSSIGRSTLATGVAQSSLRFPVRAGGPGSGRHKGSGSSEPVHLGAHNLLTKGGSKERDFSGPGQFKHVGNTNGKANNANKTYSVYDHKVSGLRYFVDSKGGWSNFRPGSSPGAGASAGSSPGGILHDHKESMDDIDKEED